MASLGRRHLLLLLIGIDKDGRPLDSVSGITRLQKFLYLLEREQSVTPDGQGFEFEPYKAGPYSSKLYDDLELLENLGLVRGEPSAESTATERADLNRLSFEDLMGGFDELKGGSRAPDAFEEKRFSLTDEGRKRAEELLQEGKADDVVSGIRTIKSKYHYYSLRDLLRYVYEKYPEMTTQSEIIDEVLRHRRR